MNSYSDSIRYLYGLQSRGMKFGFRGIHALLDSLGNPQKSFRAVHIAGTNGKGSTAAMIAAMLTAAGYRTGLYTSPHVLEFTERIRVSGRAIGQPDVVRILDILKRTVERNNTTFFETVTAMAFYYFAKQKIDIAVVETGLGGRLDATNVLQPLVSVITSIGLEHTNILGNSISKIAYEKAGIIKKGIPCISGVENIEARKTIRGIAAKRSSRFIQNRAKTKVRTVRLDGTQFIDAKFGRLKVSLAGPYQVKNATLALKVIEELSKGGVMVSPHAVKRGLAHVQKYSGLQSRLTVAQRNPLMLADVAHNPDAIKTLVVSLQDLHMHNFILVFGVSVDKDFLRMANLLKPIVDRAVVVSAQTERARSAQDLRQAFTEIHVPVEPEANVQAGVQRAVQVAGQQQPILITGSHFVVGEALAFLQKRKYLTINQ